MVTDPAVQDRRLTSLAASPRRRGPSRRRVFIEWALTAALAASVVAYMVVNETLDRADTAIYDGLMQLGRRPPLDDIVIIAIDNPSLQALGRWPWPRARHSELLNTLAQARPKAIAYDVLFVEPDADAKADQDLAAALTTAGPVFLPLLIEVPGPNGAAAQAIEPAGPLRGAAAGVGQVNLHFDRDGVARSIFIGESDGERRWLHLMELMRRQALGIAIPVSAKGHEARSPLETLTRDGRMLIPFAGPPGHFRTVSFVDVVRGEVPTEVFRDRLVLIGATGEGLGDRYPTPLTSETEVMSGVELQANILDALLTGRAIRPAAIGWVLALALAPLALLMAGLLRLRPRANMVLGLALIAATLAVSAALLLALRIWAPPAAAIAGLALVYPIWSWRRLEAASAYMVGELDALAQEPSILPQTPSTGSHVTDDVIGRQVMLMQGAVRNLRDLRQFMADSLDGLPDATLIADAGGRVLIANTAAQRLFKRLSARDPVGRRMEQVVSVFHVPPAADRGVEGEMEAPDGSTYHVRYRAFTDSTGAFTGWIARFTDISAMKTATRQREQVLELLSHDMRSPQASILALLAEGRGQGISQGAVQRVEAYARRTLALADNFVNLARAESDRYTLEIVNLSDILLDAIDDLWPQSRARSIAVVAEGCDDEHLVVADRTLLTRALINLIDNAIKYSEPKTRVQCRIATLDEGEGAKVVCTIRDQGCGMSSESVGNLFERFQRAMPTGGRQVSGVGLGLTFVQTVILRHGGQIACESALGEGSCFTLTLPRAEPDGVSA
ncbi:MAG: histidine kinase [Phenylobacterium sp.]|jgi:CHASE2 domain-containing sensor protein/signal transduction histidine kinase|nr:histidine kinase [Phenylobacterium sp.]